MTEKRYYQRDFEELYYIIDSNIISENEFDEKVEYDGYTAFEDSMTGDEIVDLLNENEELKQEVTELKEAMKRMMVDMMMRWCGMRFVDVTKGNEITLMIVDLQGNFYELNSLHTGGNDLIGLVIKKPNEEYVSRRVALDLLNEDDGDVEWLKIDTE